MPALSKAVTISCPGKCSRNGFRTKWSKSTLTIRASRRISDTQAPSRGEPLIDLMQLIETHTVLEVFQQDSHRKTGALEHHNPAKDTGSLMVFTPSA